MQHWGHHCPSHTPLYSKPPDTRVPMLTGQKPGSTHERGQAVIISMENPPPIHHTHGWGMGFVGLQIFVPWPIPQINPWQNPWQSLLRVWVSTGMSMGTAWDTPGLLVALPILEALLHVQNVKNRSKLVLVNGTTYMHINQAQSAKMHRLKPKGKGETTSGSRNLWLSLHHTYLFLKCHQQWLICLLWFSYQILLFVLRQRPLYRVTSQQTLAVLAHR